MPAKKQIKLLSVRVPEPELRRLKSVAAARGLTVQDAVQEALAAWTSPAQLRPLESLDSLQGSLGDVDFEEFRRRERQLEAAKA